MRAYAIGDIHGQIDLLHRAHDRVEADRARVDDYESPLVHLGDLTDRGPQSREVIDYLIAGHEADEPWVTIKGNHDNMFMTFLDDPLAADPGLRPEMTWLHPRLGGGTTLASYGIEGVEDRTPEDLHTEAMAKIPASHHAFLRALPIRFEAAHCLFVHAGIRPGVPLARQTDEDMMWIRGDFHKDKSDHGPLIVHGHTPVDVPTHYGNRVNLDTGAAYDGPLTAAVIEDGAVWILTKDGREPLPAPKRSRWRLGF